MCGSVFVSANAHGGWEFQVLLELKLLEVVSYVIWVLGTTLRAFATWVLLTAESFL